MKSNSCQIILQGVKLPSEERKEDFKCAAWHQKKDKEGME